MSGDGRGRLFGTVAESYDRFRPGPPPATTALMGELAGRDVLEVGAGTGKFTRFLLALGANVSVIEPDQAMLAVLVRRSPDVRVLEGRAEALGLDDMSCDVVCSSSAWHWFEHPAADDEMARVLRDNGALYVVWNGVSRLEPWMVELVALRERANDPLVRPRGWGTTFGDESPFVDARDVAIDWTWPRTIEEVVGHFETYSGLLIADEPARARMRTDVRALLHERFGDGPVALPMTFRGTIARRRPR